VPVTFDEIATVVRELDEGAEVRARADGGFVLSRSGATVGVAANVNDAAFRRCISDAVIALGMILVSRALAPADDGAWRADIERRLSALERLRPPTGQKASASPSESSPNQPRTLKGPDGIPTVRAVKTPDQKERNQPVKHSNTPAPTNAPAIIARPVALVGVVVDARSRTVLHRNSANFEGTELGDESSNGTVP
jgi:hypothetical protein